MVIALIGESCAGKSTLAQVMRRELGAEVITGRDYLRMAKSEAEATELFRKKLAQAVAGDSVVYVITEPEHLALLPEGAIHVLVSADLATIKTRFAARMHGVLPAPVERMLERRHGSFDQGVYDYRFDGVTGDAAALCEALKGRT